MALGYIKNKCNCEGWRFFKMAFLVCVRGGRRTLRKMPKFIFLGDISVWARQTSKGADMPLGGREQGDLEGWGQGRGA